MLVSNLLMPEKGIRMILFRFRPLVLLIGKWSRLGKPFGSVGIGCKQFNGRGILWRQLLWRKSLVIMISTGILLQMGQSKGKCKTNKN